MLAMPHMSLPCRLAAWDYQDPVNIWKFQGDIGGTTSVVFEAAKC